MRFRTTSLSAIAAACLLAGVGVASAATISVSPANSTAVNTAGGPTSPATINIVYNTAGGGGDVNSLEVELAFSATDLTLANATAGTGFNCDINPGLLLITQQNVGTTVPDNLTLCALTFTVAATATNGTKNLTLQNEVGGFDGNPVAVDLNDGTVEITAAPVATPPTIGAGNFTASGGGGQIGQTVNVGTISFAITTAASNGGTGSITCSDAAGGPAFVVSPAGTQTIDEGTASPVNFSVSCPLTDTAQNGDVTCAINDTGGARNETFSVDCPAGTVPPPVAPPPTLIPSGSLWSYLALLGVVVLLGGVVLSRRQ